MEKLQVSREVLSNYASARGTPHGSSNLDTSSHKNKPSEVTFPANSTSGLPPHHLEQNAVPVVPVGPSVSAHMFGPTAPVGGKSHPSSPTVSSPLAPRVSAVRSNPSSNPSVPPNGSASGPSQPFPAHGGSLLASDVKHASLVGLYTPDSSVRPGRPVRMGPGPNTPSSHSSHQLSPVSAAPPVAPSTRMPPGILPKLGAIAGPDTQSPAPRVSASNSPIPQLPTASTSPGGGEPTMAPHAVEALSPPQPSPATAPHASMTNPVIQLLMQGFDYLRAEWGKTKLGQGVIDFWTLNLIFISTLALVGSVIIFSIEVGRTDLPVHYSDCLFLAASAVTVTGMSPFEFAQLRQGSIVTCYCLMTLGSTIVLSIPPVLIRRYLYRVRFGNPATRAKRGRLESTNMSRYSIRDTLQRSGMALASVASQIMPKVDVPKLLGSITSLNEHSGEATEGNSIQSTAEYEAAGLLLKIYVGYIVGAQLLGILILGVYGTVDKTTNALLAQYGSNPLTWAIFHTASAFYNVGLGLLPGSLTLFKFDNFVLVVTCTLLAMGNCLFPVVLRAIVVILVKVGGRGGLNRRTTKSVRFLLKNPRRASIHLFKRRDTWFLFLTWAVTIATQLLSSMLFDFPVPSFRELTPIKRFGVFFLQSVSNRTGGFYIYQMESFTPVTLLVFLGFMYADSYPLLTIIRKSGASGQVEEVVRHAIERSKSHRAGGQLSIAADSVIASQTLMAAKSLLMRGFNSDVQLEGLTNAPEHRSRLSSSRSANEAAHQTNVNTNTGGPIGHESVASSLARHHINALSAIPALPPVLQSPAQTTPSSPVRPSVMERHPLVQRIRAESALRSSGSAGTTGRGLSAHVPTAVGNSHLALGPNGNTANGPVSSAASKAALGSMFLVPLGLVQSHGPPGQLGSIASLRLSRIVGGTFEDISRRSGGSLPPTNEAMLGPNGEMMQRSPTHVTAVAPIVPIVSEHRGVVNWIVQDLFWVFSAMLVIAMVEATNPYNATRNEFDMFGLLFNCVSAYGTVGLSLGTTFGTRVSTSLQDLSQIVLVLLMLVGRCRGIPATIDYSFASEDGGPEIESQALVNKDPESAYAARAAIVQSAQDSGMPRAPSTRRASVGSIVAGKLAAASTSIQAVMSRQTPYQEMESPAIRITGSTSTSGIIPRVQGSLGALPEPVQEPGASLSVQPIVLAPGVRMASTDDVNRIVSTCPVGGPLPVGQITAIPQIRPRSASHSVKVKSTQSSSVTDSPDARVAISTMITTERHVGSAFTSTTVVATPDVANVVMGMRLTAAKGDPQIGTGTTVEGGRHLIVTSNQVEQNVARIQAGIAPDMPTVPTVLADKSREGSDESVHGHRRSISLPVSTIDLRIISPHQDGKVGEVAHP